MKQGVITVLPKPEKYTLPIENWHPISLVEMQYKRFSSIYASRLKKGLEQIISETQTGFMKTCHINCNFRLLDYANFVERDSLILFIDFQHLITIEHAFRIHSLKQFGFVDSFINANSMLHNDINSSVILGQQMSKSRGVNINRGVQQGCPASPFLFLVVVKLLSLSIVSEVNFQGTIFDKDIKIPQLADDTTLFLRDKSRVIHTILSKDFQTHQVYVITSII